MTNTIRALAIALASSIAATAVNAAPLCPEFASPDLMPSKYRKLAPVLSGGLTDWIITDDQMDLKYVPNDQSKYLLGEIAKAFEARGTKLAIVMAPPRPLIAGQEAIDALGNNGDEFKVDAVAASFNEMVSFVQSTGIIMPNLLEVATASEEVREKFYYRHDTHWTPHGAARSAVALAEAVAAAELPAFARITPSAPDFTSTTEVLAEEGSLAVMANKVCGANVPPVETPFPAFDDQQADLLGDGASDKPQIILAGSSFSNRYKRDAYRVADAIASTISADVTNVSVAGGGAIGGIEGAILTGMIDKDNPPALVVWELPYTEGLGSPSTLRQLLGALQMNDDAQIAASRSLDASGETMIALANSDAQLITFKLPNTEIEEIKVRISFEKRKDMNLKLRRKDHVPAALRSDYWSLSLSGMTKDKPLAAKVTYDAKSLGSGAEFSF